MGKREGAERLPQPFREDFDRAARLVGTFPSSPEGGLEVEDQDRTEQEEVEAHTNKASHKASHKAAHDEGEDVEGHSHKASHKAAPAAARNDEGDDVEGHMHKASHKASHKA
jgi:hypothetical protein